MTAIFNKTPILFAALLTLATPAFAGDWWTIPGTDGICTLYNQNLECVDAARSFLASSRNDGPSYSYVAVDPYPADGDPFLALRSYPSSAQGDRIMKMRNGTLLQVLQRRADGWWFVETPSGTKGWAKSGAGAQAWIQCCLTVEEED